MPELNINGSIKSFGSTKNDEDHIIIPEEIVLLVTRYLEPTEPRFWLKCSYVKIPKVVYLNPLYARNIAVHFPKWSRYRGQHLEVRNIDGM